MTDTPENMVLRTLYLPLETDRQLKAIAFTRDVSKGELMRELIKKGLEALAASGERSLAEQLRVRHAQPVASAPKRTTLATNQSPRRKSGRAQQAAARPATANA